MPEVRSDVAGIGVLQAPQDERRVAELVSRMRGRSEESSAMEKTSGQVVSELGGYSPDRMPVSPEDGLAFDQMTDAELEIEATDLRSGIEAITLDLLDDAKGDFYRGNDWRKRARAARSYKKADLDIANVILRQREAARERERKDAARGAQTQLEASSKDRKANGRDVHLAQLATKLAIHRERTERHRITTEGTAAKDRVLLATFKRLYGLEAYQNLVREAGFKCGLPSIKATPDKGAVTGEADG